MTGDVPAPSGKTTADRAPPLIAHVIFRLGVGGLENGLVNLVNRLPADKYRHAIVCIDRVTAFSDRLARADVELISIHKRPGTDIRAFGRLYRTFRRLRPDIVHTRNLGALDALVPAWLAGVRRRIHGEHGWDSSDVSASNRKYRLLRRLHAPLVGRFVALSEQLADYLVNDVGVDRARIHRICNGVDAERFVPVAGETPPPAGSGDVFAAGNRVIGTIGRLEPEKNPLGLVEAFHRLLDRLPAQASSLRLALVGSGSLAPAIRQRAAALGIDDRVWLPGARDDIVSILQHLDLFALPSLAEGISNTILEAMATGLPVVATRVGGNPELLVDGETGLLVPAGDSAALAAALERYLRDPGLRTAHARAARERIVSRFGLATMVAEYECLYDAQLARDPGRRQTASRS